MIDFRYHLVSIVAVFLALTVGIVLGTTMLQDPLLNTLQSETSDLRSQSEELRAEKDVTDRYSLGGDHLAAAYSDDVLGDRLTGRKVVVLESPGVDEELRTGVVERIEQAGGSVPGRLVFTDKYLDPGQETFVNELTDQLAGGFELPRGGAHERSAAELARAVLRPDQHVADDSPEPSQSPGTGEGAGAADAEDTPSAEPSAAEEEEDPAASGAAGGQFDAEAVLSGFEGAGLLGVQGDPAEKADIGIVLAPAKAFATGEEAAAPQKDALPPGNDAMLALAGALAGAADGAVLVGGATSIGPGGLVAQARAEEPAFSTVDTGGRAAGDVAAALAIAAAVEGRSGHYGIGEGVDGFLPGPRPGEGGADDDSQDRKSPPADPSARADRADRAGRDGDEERADPDAP
ncbi:copper transporter [Nocardiopsis mangrovi]|uniref:Copper transporter n=1 Tax=Nocardiopsis mangrovi TaxID=1179818 RepID=A0ABV9E3T2_9ACTN